MTDSEMRETAQKLEAQLEKLYIITTGVSFAFILLFATCTLCIHGLTSFGIILASGLSLIILIIAAAILSAQKKSYKGQSLQQLLAIQHPENTHNVSNNTEQNQYITSNLQEELPQTGFPGSPSAPEVISDNPEQIQNIKQNNKDFSSSHAVNSAPEQDDSERLQSVTQTFTNFLSQNSQEYQLSLALFRDIKAIRSSLSAKPD